MCKELIKDTSTQGYRGTVQINHDTTCHKYMETETGITREEGIKRETDPIATMETKINCQRKRERERERETTST